MKFGITQVEDGMNRNTILGMVVIVLATAALACSTFSGKAPDAAATVQAVATEAKSGTPVATAKPGSVPTTAPGGDNPLSLKSRDSGLDKLKSYKMKWVAEWKATEAGATDSASFNWTEEYVANPKALHWLWNIASSKDKATNMEWWQIGNTTYMQTTEGGKPQCISFSSDDAKDQLAQGLFNPGSLGSVRDAKYVGAETVNGVKTKHYKYDEKGAALFGAAKVAGDMWVAVDGGYVVKETVNVSGASGLFGLGSKAKGDGKWTWELTDIDKPLTIKAPEGCGGAAADIPLMSDASEKSMMGDIIIYKTASKVADVVAFYKKQMPAAGWKAGDEPSVTDELATLEFTKNDQQASIMITVDKNKTQVMITVQK